MRDGYVRAGQADGALAADIRAADKLSPPVQTLRYVESRGFGPRSIYVRPHIAAACKAFELLARRRVYLTLYMRMYTAGTLDSLDGGVDTRGQATPEFLARLDAEPLL